VRPSLCELLDLSLGHFVGSEAVGVFRFGDPAAAALMPLASGCAGTAGTPVLHGEDAPRLGRTLTLRLAKAPSGAPFFGMLGAATPSWLGAPLPIDLTSLGMPGCELATAIDAHQLRLGTDWPIAVPAAAPLLGGHFRVQAFVFDAGANTLGATTSNAVALRIGS
jgi:hypothetical protein